MDPICKIFFADLTLLLDFQIPDKPEDIPISRALTLLSVLIFKVPLTQKFFFIVLKDRIQYIALVKIFFNFIKYCGFYCVLNMEFAGPAPLS